MAPTDPAFLLAQQFAEWTVGEGQAAVTARGGRSEQLSFWHEQTQAIHWLEEIEQCLAGLRARDIAVGSFESSLSEWYSGVFSMQHPWLSGSPSGGLPISDSGLTILYNLSVLIQATKLIPELSDDELDRMFKAAGEAADAIGTAGEWLDDPTRGYLSSLIERFIAVLNDVNDVGGYTVHKVSRELGGALLAAAARDDAPPEAQSKLAKLAIQVVSTGFSTAYTSAVSVLTTVATMGVIERAAN